MLSLFVNLGLVDVVFNFLYFFRDAQVLDHLNVQKKKLFLHYVYGIHWLISHNVTRLHSVRDFLVLIPLICSRLLNFKNLFSLEMKRAILHFPGISRLFVGQSEFV